MTGERVSVGIRLPKSMHETLQHEAEARGVSMNWLVNKALEWWLPRLIPINEVPLIREEQP